VPLIRQIKFNTPAKHWDQETLAEWCLLDPETKEFAPLVTQKKICGKQIYSLSQHQLNAYLLKAGVEDAATREKMAEKLMTLITVDGPGKFRAAHEVVKHVGNSVNIMNKNEVFNYLRSVGITNEGSRSANITCSFLYHFSAVKYMQC
jgi:thermostable 8-oxoguanine DNA glycosylase